MGMLAIVFIFLVIIAIFFMINKGNGRKGQSKVKSKSLIDDKIIFIIPLYFITLIILAIVVQSVYTKANNEYIKVSQDDYERLSKNKGFSINTIKEDESIFLGESKKYLVKDKVLKVTEEYEGNSSRNIVVKYNEGLKDEILITPFKKRSFIESNGNIYDITKIFPLSNVTVSGNNINVNNENFNIKINTIISGSGFDKVGDIFGLSGIIIEVPREIKVTSDNVFNIMKEE